LELEGFPGLYIYPKLLNPVHGELVWTLLEDELSNPSNITNVHEDYYVVYPMDGKSFFSPDASQVKMQPRLHGDRNWTTPSISAHEFLEKLRWFAISKDTSRSTPTGLPARIEKLMASVLPYPLRNGTAYISSSQNSLRLRQGNVESNGLVNVSLGCGVIVVVPLEDVPEFRPRQAKESMHGVNEESWRDFIVDLESEDEMSPAQSKAAVGLDKDEPSAPSFEAAWGLVAIHLRADDVLACTGPTRKSWCGVAQVLPRNSPNELQHQTFQSLAIAVAETSDSHPLNEYMRSRRIDLILHWPSNRTQTRGCDPGAAVVR
jgi:hypothetical protein